MPITPLLMEYAKRTDDTVRRWDTTLNIPEDADDKRAASMIRSALIRAAANASKFNGGPYYHDDHSWSHEGIRGITRDRIREEVAISRDKMAPAPEEWGIMARVISDGMFFDIPIAIDLDADSARNILNRIEGMEEVFVDIESLGRCFPGEDFKIFFHTDNWGKLREFALEGFILMDEALDFRRPVVWDLLRARLSELPCEPLNPFSEEEFFTRFAKSSRFDPSLMRASCNMVEDVARLHVNELTPEWGEWHPAIIDLLNTIGAARRMDGISIILNFVLQEPKAEQDYEREDPRIDWQSVGYHNLIVAYGLHPLAAIYLLDFVKKNPTAFYDLPSSDDRRYVLVGASAIQDTMLSAMRVSSHGRTDAYDKMVKASENEDTIDF